MSSTLTGGQLGGLCGVSRQAIAQAKKKGILFTDSDGLYNPDHPSNRKYIDDHKLKNWSPSENEYFCTSVQNNNSKYYELYLGKMR